jgi:hypothetical protein
MENKLVLPAITEADNIQQVYYFDEFYNTTSYLSDFEFHYPDNALFRMEIHLRQENTRRILGGALSHFTAACESVPKMHLFLHVPVNYLRGQYHIDRVLASKHQLQEVFALQLVNECGDKIFYRLDVLEQEEAANRISLVADLYKTLEEEGAPIQILWQNGVSEETLGEQYDIYCDIANALVDWFGKYGEEYILDLSRYVPKD